LQQLPRVVTTKAALALISDIAAHEGIVLDREINVRAENIYAKYGLGNVKLHSPIQRGAFAALVDELLNPFHSKEIDLLGKFK
jgi:hypothetical protein